MTEKIPTTTSPEKPPKLDQAAAKKAESSAVESHGEEKKSGWIKKGSWGLLMLVTGIIFTIKTAYDGISWGAGVGEKGKIELGGGGHGGKKDGHGGGHGGGGHH